MKMKTAIICMVVIKLAIMINGRRVDLSHWADLLPDSTENCADNACGGIVAEKRNEYPMDIDDSHLEPKNVLSAQNPWQWLCPCESQYNILDLGSGKYPRYLATASCVSKSCQGKFNQCKLIHYKVHVLRQRDHNEEEQYSTEQPILPESLRVHWQLQLVKVAVACVTDN